MALAIQLQAPVTCLLNDDAYATAGHAGVRAEQNSLPPYLIRAEDDWLRTIVSQDRHLNVLVTCVDLAVPSAVAEISALCGRRLWTSLVPGILELPEHDGETVVIGDISLLTLRQQLEIYDWLDRFGPTSQVLSFTSAPLWPLVERGRFLECLFYRLNILTLTADPVRH
jgi:hypothetical protein